MMRYSTVDLSCFAWSRLINLIRTSIYIFIQSKTRENVNCIFVSIFVLTKGEETIYIGVRNS